MQSSLLLSIILLSGLLIVASASAETPSGMAEATFVVHCYDVGVSALSGKPGVIAVERGWSGTREIDRVVYDPQKVSLPQLENWLRAADTYVSTLQSSINSPSEKEMSQ